MTKITIILPDAEDVARKTYALLTGKLPEHKWGEFEYKSAHLIIQTSAGGR